MKASSLTTLDVWDDKLIALGSEIIDAQSTSRGAICTDPLAAGIRGRRR